MMTRPSRGVIRAMAVAAVLACVLVRRPTDMILAAENPTPSTTTPTTTLATTPTTTSVPGQASKGVEQRACRLVLRITSEDLSALKPLPAQTDPALREAMTNYLACLAIARKDRRYCEVLSQAEQNGCIVWSQAVEKLKAPADDKSAMAAFAPLLDYECRRLADKAGVCDELQEAISTKNIAKCRSLPEPFGTNCKAIVSGDAAQCGDDPNCKALVQDLKNVKEKGASQFTGGPKASVLAVLLAAAGGGEGRCAALLESLQKTCGEVAK